MRNYDKATNIQFFFDKIIQNKSNRVDIEKISRNFFIRGEEVKLFKVNEHVTVSDKSFKYNRNTETYTVTVTGYIHSDESQIFILPMLYTDALKVNCYAIVPIILNEPKLELDFILEEFINMELKMEYFKPKDVAKEIMTTFEEGEGGKVFVCQGVMPRPAVPDSITILESESMRNLIDMQAQIGKEFLLYEEMSFFKKVSKGEIIGTYTPRKEGTLGVDVFGNPIEFSENRAMKIGDNLKVLPQRDVVVDKDGYLKLGINGIFRVKNTIICEGNLEENIDIDEETDVIVKENVYSGLSIRTKGNVTVLGNVESSIIECGGELIVGGGITRQSKVTVKKKAEIQFISFSDINVGSDLLIRKYIIDSQVQTEGNVFVKFNKTGHITGGKISLTGHIEMNTLGSPSGKETVVEIKNVKGQYEELYDKLLLKLENNKKFIGKVNKMLGPMFLSDPVDYMKKVIPEQKKKIIPIVIQLKKVFNENKKIESNFNTISNKRIEEKKTTQSQTYVVVNQEVYDNVLIRINNTELRTNETISFPTIFQQNYNSNSISRKPYER